MTEKMTEKRTDHMGRPKKYKNGYKRVSASLPAELAPLFKQLGGSEWLQEQIRKAFRKN